MKIFLSIGFVLAVCFAYGQPGKDTLLKKAILQMFKQDQRWRIEIDNLGNGKGSAFDEATIEKNMGRTDSLNKIKAKQIVNKYGYPGYSLVGEDGSNGFWAIVQHCDNDTAFQQRVLKLMGRQVARHNASGENYALLQDRVLVNTGHPQVYGTQVRIDTLTHHAKPFPIADSVHVDARRKAVGLMPLKDYLKLFDN
jgi:hypothetical protein